MKKLLLIYFIFTATNLLAADHISAAKDPDSATLPECIKKLSRPGKKGIRSYNGGQQYLRTQILKDGKTIYQFRSEASLGCNSNQPAGSKYFNDSCKLIAYFPAGFSIKQGFKPFIADGYLPDDFAEASIGDYPLYFSNLTKKTAENNAKVTNPFPVEKTFRIEKSETNSLEFKTGDIIKISSQNGLRHYRKNALVNSYKIMPQLAIFKIEAKCKVPPCFSYDKNEVVFYLDGAQSFIDIRNSNFFVSVQQYTYLNKPTTPMRIAWKKMYELKEL